MTGTLPAGQRPPLSQPQLSPLARTLPPILGKAPGGSLPSLFVSILRRVEAAMEKPYRDPPTVTAQTVQSQPTTPPAEDATVPG